VAEELVVEIDRLSKYKRLALRTVLLALMIHTVLPLVIDTLMRLISPYPWLVRGRFKQGVLVWELPPWHERLLWGQMFSQCVALIFEIKVWRFISRRKRCAWPYLAVMVMATMFYLFGVGGTTLFLLAPLLLPDKYLLYTTLFGLIVLWLTRSEFAVKPMQMVEIAASILLAGVIVFISGYYFPHGIIDWAVQVPAYVDIIARSRFKSPQESLLVLCVVCFYLVRATVLGIRKKGGRAVAPE